MNGIHIVSFNARGLNEMVKRREVFQFIRDKNVDIALIQESHSSPKKENIWRNEWGGGSIFFLHSDTNVRGVCILCKSKHFKITKLSRDNERRVLVIEFEYEGTLMVLCNLYAPNNDNLGFFLQVFKMLEVFDSPSKILGGILTYVLI